MSRRLDLDPSTGLPVGRKRAASPAEPASRPGLTSARRRALACAVALVALFMGWRACAPAHVQNLSPRPGPVVILGDSISAGVGSASGKGYVGLLSERLGVELVNRGVSGNTTADGLARLDADVLSQKPALVVVELGGNDFLRKVDPEETFGNLETIIRRCQGHGAAVLLLGMRSGLLSDRQEGRYRDLARRTGSAYVPNLMEGILTQPALKYDAIHPNDAGYARVADRVEPTLRQMLKRMGRL